MNLELNPKLLDVVEFEESSQRTTVKRRGTIVETFGEPPNAVLIEMSDSQGLPLSYVTSKIVAADAKNELARKNLETMLLQQIPGDLMTGLIPIEAQELVGGTAFE